MVVMVDVVDVVDVEAAVNKTRLQPKAFTPYIAPDT